MKQIIEYDKLITHTSFNFNSKKEEANYWDNLLIESPIKFKNEYSNFLHEKLHVYYSFSQIFKYSGIGCLILCLINPSIILWNLVFSATFFCIGGGFYLKFKSFAISVIITDAINTIEFVNLLREEVIKIKN